jgi:hypothetical protein
MKRPCKRCGEEFEVSDLRKKCCCTKPYTANEIFGIYLRNQRKQFQNPIYQAGLTIHKKPQFDKEFHFFSIYGDE